MIKYKWPFNSATTIAILALSVSVLQFILTTPIFMNFYFQPVLKISGKGSSLDSKTLVGSFVLLNDGRSAATNVEVGFVLQQNQRIDIMPKIKSEIMTTDKDPVFTKNVRIEIPRLNAGESVVILVTPGAKGEHLDNQVADFFKSAGIIEIPFVSFIKSEQGPGANLTKGVDHLKASSNQQSSQPLRQ